MKKRDLIVVGVVIAIVVVVLGLWFLGGWGHRGEVFECDSDDECVKVPVGCCPCNMGGTEKCVPKSEEQVYLNKIENCSPNTICAAVFNCEIETCECAEGRCSEK